MLTFYLTISFQTGLIIWLIRRGLHNPMDNAWIMVISVVYMFGVPLKLGAYMLGRNSMDFRLSYLPELSHLQVEELTSAARTSLVVFVPLFCLSALWVSTHQGPLLTPRAATLGRPSPAVGATLIGLSCVLLAVRLRYGAVLGESAVGTATSNIYNRGPAALATAILSLCWATGGRCARRLYASWAILVIPLGIIATASRGYIIVSLLPGALMLWFSGYSIKRFLPLASLVLLLSVALYPAITAYRGSTTGVSGRGVEDSIRASYGSAILSTVRDAGMNSLLRSPGADGMLHVSRSRRSNFTLPLSPEGLSKTYTRKIVRLKSASDFRSPGMVASVFLLVGPGLFGILLVPLFWFSLPYLGFRSIRQSRFAIPFQATYVAFLVSFAQEGTLILNDVLSLFLGYAVTIAVFSLAVAPIEIPS